MNYNFKIKKIFITTIFLFLTIFLINKKILASSNEDLITNILDFSNIKQEKIFNKKVIPCGIAVGVKINTNGVMVLETNTVKSIEGIETNPSKNLTAGDLILSVNDKEINKKEDLIKEIKSNNELILEIKRNKEIKEINIKPVKDLDGENKIGAWVRDSTQGVGTLTYFDPENKKFGALGHGVVDIDTQELMTVKTGEIKKIFINSIVKSKTGTPGEIIGDVENGELIGKIKLNNKFGLYGVANENLQDIIDIKTKEISICDKNKIHEGNAKLKTDVSGQLEDYDIYIESIDRFKSENDLKNMIIKIIDDRLLEKTNGIVQGMSGCPIIQDDKLIGALTHVFVKDPTRGYAVFIENMIKQEKNI